MSILTDIKNAIRAIGSNQQVLNEKSMALQRAAIIRTHACFRENIQAPTTIYLTARYKRTDGTTAMTSTLGGFDSATKLYMTRVENYYSDTTQALIRTVNYAITYDDYRSPLTETITSVIIP